MAKYKYKTISLRTVKGFKQAERLQSNGWRVYLAGIDSVRLEKEVKSKSKKK